MSRCRLGLHDFPWPPHTTTLYWLRWEDFDIECSRGCGARRTRRCHYDQHWAEKHPEPFWVTPTSEPLPSKENLPLL